MPKNKSLSPEAKEILEKINSLEFEISVYKELGNYDEVKKLNEKYFEELLKIFPMDVLDFAEKNNFPYDVRESTAKIAIEELYNKKEIDPVNILHAETIIKKYNLEGEPIADAIIELATLGQSYFEKSAKKLDII